MKTKSKPLPQALTRPEIDARLAAIAAENAAAEELLKTLCNDAERWQRLQAQAVNKGIDAAQFTSLCGKMVRTRKEWAHLPLQARAIAAFHGLLVTLGSTPNAADEKALAEASAAPAGQ